MPASLHAIAARHKDHPARRAILADFALEAGTTASSRTVLETPGWSLYCLDQATQHAVFVQTPADCDLSEKPFMRMAQFEHANHVLLVPWDQLGTLAQSVHLPQNMIFVFNIGRSGTTLVSRMLGYVDGVVSLSEPNAHLDATTNRNTNGPAITRSLIASCTRLLCRQPDGTVPETVAFKLYSQSLFNCADFYAEFPQAKYVFLYRDAVSWAGSTFKMAKGFGMPDTLDRTTRDFIWGIASGNNDISSLEASLPSDGACAHEDISAACWSLHMASYMQNLAAGVPFLALRYNEMNAEREATTRSLLTHCGLPADRVEKAMQGFAQDSQHGSGIGQDNEKSGFEPENTERFMKALARQKQFNAPDLRLPDIYNQ
jgi:hypothetical protein